MLQQQQPQVEDTADLLLTVQEMQFWLDKAVAWGQAATVETQRDTCQHLSRLRDFIQQLLKHINSMVSHHETRVMWLKGLGRLWSTLSYDTEWTSFILNQLGQAAFWCIRWKWKLIFPIFSRPWHEQPRTEQSVEPTSPALIGSR